MNRLRDWAVLAGLAAFVLALDQGSKWLVRQNLAVGEAWAPVVALSHLFTVTHVQNTGVAFGQMPGLGWLFMLVNLGVLVVILAYYSSIPAEQWQLRVAAALILAGDLGNVIDRVRTAARITQATGSLWQALPRASVTDFFDFKIWPVFNVADFCVVTGVSILAITLWRSGSTETAPSQ